MRLTSAFLSAESLSTWPTASAHRSEVVAVLSKPADVALPHGEVDTCPARPLPTKVSVEAYVRAWKHNRQPVIGLQLVKRTGCHPSYRPTPATLISFLTTICPLCPSTSAAALPTSASTLFLPKHPPAPSSPHYASSSKAPHRLLARQGGPSPHSRLALPPRRLEPVDPSAHPRRLHPSSGSPARALPALRRLRTHPAHRCSGPRTDPAVRWLRFLPDAQDPHRRGCAHGRVRHVEGGRSEGDRALDPQPAARRLHQLCPLQASQPGRDLGALAYDPPSLQWFYGCSKQSNLTRR